MSLFAIQYAFADYLAAVGQAIAGDYQPLLALSETFTAVPPPDPVGESFALEVPVACGEYSAPFDLGDTLSKRLATFDRGLTELPDDAFAWFSKQGWVDSSLEQVDLCLKYPKPRLSLQLRPPYNGPFPDVPVLMLNGDIDLQTPLEMAGQAKGYWPNSAFLTIRDATHVTISNNGCALITAVSFLQCPTLPDEQTCDSPPARS